MTEHTQPLATPQGGHFPAGFASPDQHEAQQRQLLRELILREREQVARAELEAEVDRRLAAARGPQENPAAVKIAIVKDDVSE